MGMTPDVPPYESLFVVGVTLRGALGVVKGLRGSEGEETTWLWHL